jgi:glycosyltransferase involved in cell wall biosynthesis
VWEGYRRSTYWGNLLTFRRNDHVFAVSEHVRASIAYPGLLSRMRMPPVETLYHGIDAEFIAAQAMPDGVRDELGIEPDAPVVGSVANFTPQKAHRILLQAVALLGRRIPDVRVVLVGGGPLEERVRSYARELGLGSVVVFTGARADAPRIAACFDVFVLSSVQEGLSIALLEAMALGKPAVVTRVGGLPEVLSGGAGLVVPPRNPRKMAEALTSLLEDPSLRRRMSDVARRVSTSFDIRTAVRRIEQVYEELTA